MTSLVILTYNEIEGVKALFNKIFSNCINEVFVVDGGSWDGTKEFFYEKGIELVTQHLPGRGMAFKIGMLKAKYDKVIFFSPDGNENPDDITALADSLNMGYDMAIASRFMPGAHNEEDGSLFPARKIVNMIFTFIANKLWNKKTYITDTINGFRGITKQAYEAMNINAEGFTIEYQMSIKAMKLGLNVAEIPTYEGNRIGGKSKAKSIPTGIEFLKCLATEILNTKKRKIYRG